MRTYRCNKLEIRDFGRFCSVRDVAARRAWTVTGHQHTLLSLLLAARARDPDGLVAKEAIADALWSGAKLPDNFLQVIENCVFRLRQSLGNAAIRTLRGHGYRLAAEVEVDGSDAVPPAGREADPAMRLWDQYYRVTDCGPDELPRLMAINRETFGAENCWSDRNIIEIYERSPRSHVLLRDACDDGVIGFGSVFALQPAAMDRLGRLQVSEMNLEPRDFADIDDSCRNDRLYIGAVALSLAFRKRSGGAPLAVPLAARQLIVGVAELLLATGLANRERIALFAVAWTEDGDRLASRLGLERIGLSAGHPTYSGQLGQTEAQRFIVDGKRLDRDLRLLGTP